MRRRIVVSLALATLALAACKPPPAATKEYAYPAWGFRISFASPPQVTDKPAQPDGTPHSVVAESDGGGRDFAISATDAADVGVSVDQLTDRLAQMMAGDLKGEATIKTYAATAEGLDGRQFDLKQGGRPVARVRVFLAGGRFYTLAAKSAFGLEDPAVGDFLSSFHASQAPVGGTNATAPSPGA
ncbi:MAG TPA: hypothetical protein VMT68_08385 [Caulobacteraceae bacterium]|nr:hypothetical protein [Caulobacteraceae bacterium]